MSITISTKVPEELAERIEDAREEGENRSACVRRLVRAGLRDDTGERTPLPTALMWIGSIFVTANYVSATGFTGPLGVALLVGGFLLTNESINDRVRTAYAEYTDSEDSEQ